MNTKVEKTEAELAREEALAMAKAIHVDKCATINGRDYHIANVNHLKRRKVFAYFTHIQKDLSNKDFWFLETKEWADVEQTICSVVLFESESLTKRKNHWEEYPEDYFLFIQSLMPALSYPFLQGLSGS